MARINQLAAAIDLFDDQPQLPATYIPYHGTFRFSNFVPLRGRASFERLSGGYRGLFMRVTLDGQVYPVPYCWQGPGRSCSLKQYEVSVANKSLAFGDLRAAHSITNPQVWYQMGKLRPRS